MTWPHDDTRALIAYYGDPRGSNGEVNQRWALQNLVPVKFPWRAVCSWDHNARVSSARMHVKCADECEVVFQRIWELVSRNQSKIEEMGMHFYGGAFNYRVKRGLSSLSVHAFGAAIDFDPERNGLGDPTPYMPKLVVDAFKSQGAIWGGDFKSRKDGMHFQFATI